MRKIFTLAFFLILSGMASAQMQKDQVLIGGSIGVSQQKQETNGQTVRNSATNINPSVGWLYKDNRMAGLNLYYSGSNSPSNNYKSKYGGAGIFVRQYLPLVKTLYLFAEEGLNVTIGSYDQTNSPDMFVHGKQTTAGLYFYPGLAYTLSKRLQLELALTRLVSLNYAKEVRTETGFGSNKTVSNAFGLQMGAGDNSVGNLTFGIRFLLK